jgi:hypothetical protein
MTPDLLPAVLEPPITDLDLAVLASAGGPTGVHTCTMRKTC